MSNIRNTRTKHPRKQARRDRAAQRFDVKPHMRKNAVHMKAKKIEALALGLSASSEWFIATFGAAA